MKVDFNVFAEKFKKDKNEALYELIILSIDYINQNTKVILGSYNVLSSVDSELFFEDLLEIYGLIYSMVEDINETMPYEVIGNISEDLEPLANFLIKIKDECKIKKMSSKFNKSSNKFKSLLNDEFMYHFSEDEIERIQELINVLRENISASTLFEEEHKQRLLKRLEKLQSELHKSMSDLDMFWGLVGDAGVVIGKFGEDVKPMVDRIKELTSIVWKAQRRSEQLPHDNSSHPLIEDQEAV